MPAVQEEVGRLLSELGLTISVAEACTAGLVGSMLCSVPGSSRYFYGGVITYTGGGPSPGSLECPRSCFRGKAL